ncbi:MAG: hypothetical protein WAW17_33820, partial [Rhodococcus sp. (in: high G+C Gram-positive bacteria)]
VWLSTNRAANGSGTGVGGCPRLIETVLVSVSVVTSLYSSAAMRASGCALAPGFVHGRFRVGLPAREVERAGEMLVLTAQMTKFLARTFIAVCYVN